MNILNETSSMVKVGKIHPHPENPRIGNIDAIVESIKVNGFYGALVVQKASGNILAGNHRYLAAIEAGASEVPVIFVDVSDEEATRILLADNRTADLGTYNQEQLVELLQSLEDTAGTGYNDQDLSKLLDELEKGMALPPDIDDVPAAPSEPRTRPGDIWTLGEHRLICGSATNEADHHRLLDGAAIDLVLTDPPYGVNIDYGRGIGDYDTFDDTEDATGELIDMFVPLVRGWPVVLITTGHRMLWRYPAPDWLLAWVVPAGNGRGPWGFTCWTPIAAYGKDPYLQRGMGSRPDQVTMMATRDTSVEGHPVIKPIEVWKWLMERGAPLRGQRVLDTFCGSGTTLIAAELTGRIGYGIELSPAYCDVTCARFQKLTDTVPLLERTGEEVSFLD